MNSQQEKFQTLGFFGIFKEAFKTIFSAKKIFALITLAMIFPLSLLMFSHLHVLQFLFERIDYNYVNLYYTASGSSEHKGIVHRLVVLWIIFSISNAAYLVVVFILYLLSTSSVVYTLVSIYAGNKAITFRELVSVVVKFSKKFMIDSVLMLLNQILFLMFLISMCLWNLREKPRWDSDSIAMVDVLLTAVGVFFCGSLNLEWHLACVFSIMEELSYSTNLGKDTIFTLTKGKGWFVHSIVAVVQLSAVITLGSYNLLVLQGNLPDFVTISKVSYWILFIFLLSTTILLGFVIQTLIYFVCKAGLGKSIIDKPCVFVVPLQEDFAAGKNATTIKDHTFA